jgi:hypothetical protein
VYRNRYRCFALGVRGLDFLARKDPASFCLPSHFRGLLFGFPIGSSEGQQLWECLAVLVALRIWRKHFKDKRVTLRVRGDNVGSLVLLLKMRPSSPSQAIIARELALLLVDAAFPPEVIHTPGVAHKVADHLSRVFCKSSVGDEIISHPALRVSTRSVVPARPRAWYLTLIVP